MADNTWARVPTTNTLQSALANAAGAGNVMAYGGAITVDQNTGEMIHAAGGGHTDGNSNQVVALNLRGESPTWTRLWGPTANPNTGSGWNSHAYSDGQPRSVHAWGACCWAAGNVVYPSMQGMYNTGQFSSAVYSWNRSTGPSNGWVFRGLAITNPLGDPGSWNFEASPSCYDSKSNAFYTFIASNAGNGLYRVNASTWASTVYDIQTNPAYQYHSWAVAVPEDHYAFTNDANGSNIYIVDTNNPGAGYTTRTPTGAARNAAGSGIVYHPGTKACYAWHNQGNTVSRLSVPSNGNFASGTFAWTTIGGGVSPPNFPSSSGYTAFNIVQDIGNGRSALVMVNSPSGSVYAFKLPTS